LSCDRSHAGKWAIQKGFRVRLPATTRFAALVLAQILFSPSTSRADERVQIDRNLTEARVVLRLAALHAAQKPIKPSEWEELLEGEPYRLLRDREASMHAPFTDAEFQAFVLSPALASEEKALSGRLDEWEKADLARSAQRVLAYLPATAQIHAKVFVVVKPRTNSFVYRAEGDPAIFLSLKTGVSEAKFENTVAHEMHHIGLDSIENRDPKGSPGVQKALEWIGAFGEGFAMLAAAGDTATHPHAHSAPADRARWDADIGKFPANLAAVDRFLLDLASDRLGAKEAEEQGAAFYGDQGPWYTVGYTMAVTIENRFGRGALIECMEHPERLIGNYNEAAALATPPLPAFTPDLVRRLSEEWPAP
jgi:hypothetical protein